jgi:hypothetical protein
MSHEIVAVKNIYGWKVLNLKGSLFMGKKMVINRPIWHGNIFG